MSPPLRGSHPACSRRRQACRHKKTRVSWENAGFFNFADGIPERSTREHRLFSSAPRQAAHEREYHRANTAFSELFDFNQTRPGTGTVALCRVDVLFL